MAKTKPSHTPRIVNKKARFNYEILERIEAGIALFGTEVKSLRGGQVSLNEAFARIQGNEIYLTNCQIEPYDNAGPRNHDPNRPRKLLLHRREIRKLIPKVRERGQTLVPLAIYFNSRGLAKVDLAVVRGKAQYDKRQTLKTRQQKRDVARAIRGR